MESDPHRIAFTLMISQRITVPAFDVPVLIISVNYRRAMRHLQYNIFLIYIYIGSPPIFLDTGQRHATLSAGNLLCSIQAGSRDYNYPKPSSNNWLLPGWCDLVCKIMFYSYYRYSRLSTCFLGTVMKILKFSILVWAPGGASPDPFLVVALMEFRRYPIASANAGLVPNRESLQLLNA